MSAEHNISPQDYELLSAYLDDELSDVERATVDQRLSNEPRLTAELNSLRSTVALIHQLPTMTAPRDFTITQAMIQPSKVIPLRPKPRAYTPYLSLVASITLMIFGGLFMLSDITPTDTSSAPASEAIQQSEPVTGSLGEVAVLPTNTAIDPNSEADRARIEPQTPIDTIQEETTEEEAVPDLANVQAPANNAVTGETAFDSEAPDSDQALDESAVDEQEEGLNMVAEDDATELQIMDSEMGDADVAGGADEFFDTTADDMSPPSEPQPMAGASFAEPVTSTSTDNSDDAFAESESLQSQILEEEGDAPEEIVSDGTEAETNDSVTPDRRDLLTPTAQPTPPYVAEKVNEPQRNNLPIGVGLLAIGVLLLTPSLVMIRRHRS